MKALHPAHRVPTRNEVVHALTDSLPSLFPGARQLGWRTMSPQTDLLAFAPPVLHITTYLEPDHWPDYCQEILRYHGELTRRASEHLSPPGGLAPVEIRWTMVVADGLEDAAALAAGLAMPVRFMRARLLTDGHGLEAMYFEPLGHEATPTSPDPRDHEPDFTTLDGTIAHWSPPTH